VVLQAPRWGVTLFCPPGKKPRSRECRSYWVYKRPPRCLDRGVIVSGAFDWGYKIGVVVFGIPGGACYLPLFHFTGRIGFEKGE
jgi:hypothetical protein